MLCNHTVYVKTVALEEHSLGVKFIAVYNVYIPFLQHLFKKIHLSRVTQAALINPLNTIHGMDKDFTDISGMGVSGVFQPGFLEIPLKAWVCIQATITDGHALIAQRF